MASGLQLGQVNTILNAATATGAGSAFAVPTSPNAQRGGFIQTMTVQVNVTGSPSAADVQLQGSLDGTNWNNIGSAIDSTGSSAFGVFNLSATATGPYAQIRANLTTLTGGTTPTVTVLLALGAI